MRKIILILSLCLLLPQACFAFEDFCDTYDRLKSPQSASILDLRILKPQGTKIGLLILGTPKDLRITANGISLKPYKVKSEEVICSRVRAGEIAWYDLKALKLDAAFIEAQSGTVKTQAQITFK